MISDQIGAGKIRQDVQDAIRQEIDARLCFVTQERAAPERAASGLQRKEKELILMALACIQERAPAAELHARAAMLTGASLEEVTEVAVLTIIERGMPQFKMAGLPAIEAAEAMAGGARRPAPRVEPVAAETPRRIEEIRAYVREVLGVELPDMWVKLSEVAPYALDGYMRIRQGVVHDHGAASKKVKELTVTAMDILIANSWGAQLHARQARRDGASVQEVAEAVALTMIEGGLQVYVTGGEAVIRAAEGVA